MWREHASSIKKKIQKTKQKTCIMTLSPIRVDLVSSSSTAGKSRKTRYVEAQKNTEKGRCWKSVDISEKMKRQVQLKVFILSPKRGNSSGQNRKWR